MTPRLMCNKKGISYLPLPDLMRPGITWCSAKWPCGACGHRRSDRRRCGSLVHRQTTFDKKKCLECKDKFICYTSPHKDVTNPNDVFGYYSEGCWWYEETL